MPQGIVVLAGSLPVDNLELELLVAEFGWLLKAARSPSGIAQLNLDHDVVTVFFSPRTMELPWDQALRSVLKAAPRALPILCHGFSERIPWTEATEAGAFHSLLMPFDAGEVRQSLGFVWGAKRRSTAIEMRRRPEPEAGNDDQAPAGRGRAAGFVA